MLNALIVTYNKECENCKNLNKLLEYKEHFSIIIFDNSTIKTNNSEFCKNHGITYLTKNENVGLSKAYNYTIDTIKKNPDEYILILDDDTELSDAFIKEALEETNKKEFDVILPVVKSNQIIMSPANIQFGCRGKNVKKITDIKFDKITAINSGMIIKLSIFEQIRYNEELFLDSVDHDFMKQVRKHNKKIKIMNSELFQNYSREEKISVESALTRFKIFKKDFKVYCRNSNRLWFYYLSITKFAIKECIKYRTFRFIKAV